MRVVYLCGHRSLFGRQCWQALRSSRLAPAAVVVARDRTWTRFDIRLNQRRNRSFRRRLRTFFYARKWSRWLRREVGRSGVPVLHLDNVNSVDGQEAIRALEPDIILTAAYPQIFDSGLVKIPFRGFINFHPSLLPAFAGAHPHFWAIREGAAESGVSAHLVTPQIDRGRLLAQVRFPIADLTYGELYERIGQALPQMTEELAAHLLDGQKPILRNADVKSSWYSNNQPEDARIQWDQHSTEEIHNLVRTGIAWCIYRTRKMRLLMGRPVVEPEGVNTSVPPGTIQRSADGRIVIRCRDGWLQPDRWRFHNSRLRPRLRRGRKLM